MASSTQTEKQKTSNSPVRSAPRLNRVVFWPPFSLLLAAVGINFVAPDAFRRITNSINDWVITKFDWLFSLVAFSSVVLCVFICFSPFGRVRLGGRDAKPLLKMWNWFAITVCTTIAVGILLWATAEPVSHFRSPPGTRITAGSQEAATFAMSAMYLHWTFTPYAIYAVASLMFSFAYYNMKKPYMLGASLTPLFGDKTTGSYGNIIDAVCLYSLVAGMAASLGSGILILAGGLNYLLPAIDGKSPIVWAIIAGLIITTFVISSATGLMKGIRILSSVNTYALFVLAAFIFLAGPTFFIMKFGLSSFGNYLTEFFGLHFYSDSGAIVNSAVEGAAPTKSWAHSWTIFYWAVWLAWTPITACFLGQIAYGRTVREFMLVNFLLPSLFGACWMAIFSGTALHFEMNGASLATLLEPDSSGQTHYEQIAFALFKEFPLTGVLAVFYLCSTFVCFVTSADSNTTAMAAISSTGITPENAEGGLAIKVAWGVTIGLVAWVMISFADIEGIKIISTLGGFPAAILMVLVIFSLAKVVWKYEEYDVVDRDG